MENYATWLENTQKEVEEAITLWEEVAEASSSRPVHPDAGFALYNRLLTWRAALISRREWYESAKSRTKTQH